MAEIRCPDSQDKHHRLERQLQEYSAAGRMAGLSEETLETRCREVRELAVWCDADPLKIDGEQLERYLATVSDRESAAERLQAFSRWAALAGHSVEAQEPLPAPAAPRKRGGKGRAEPRVPWSLGPIGGFMIYQRRRNLSEHTIEGRRSRVTAFELWLGAHGRGGLLDARTEDINQWLDSQPITSATRYIYIGHFNAFYRWAQRDDLIARNPVDKIDRPKRAQRLPRPMGDDELTLAMEYAEPRMYAWLHLAAFQGFRCIEISRLRVEDIDRQSMSLRVFGKGSKDAVLPLHPGTLAALVRFGLPTSGYVFTKQHSADPFAPASVSRYIAGYLHSLGSKATAHQGRHWYGTSIHRLTGDLLITRDLLRHASSQTSELYAQVTADRGRDIVGQLSLASPAVGIVA